MLGQSCPDDGMYSSTVSVCQTWLTAIYLRLIAHVLYSIYIYIYTINAGFLGRIPTQRRRGQVEAVHTGDRVDLRDISRGMRLCALCTTW
jgi:hypothetical protein